MKIQNSLAIELISREIMQLPLFLIKIIFEETDSIIVAIRLNKRYNNL
jgi:hypothetical protein